jgi:hypothetical protein
MLRIRVQIVDGLKIKDAGPHQELDPLECAHVGLDRRPVLLRWLPRSTAGRVEPAVDVVMAGEHLLESKNEIAAGKPTL